MKALKDAVIREVGKGTTEEVSNIRQVMEEESPVGESKSNGEVERAIQEVQGQVRTIKDGLETKYNVSVIEDHPILPWAVRHAPATLNRFLKGTVRTLELRLLSLVSVSGI